MKGKTVVITGCTRGLGRAMIPRFIDAGWQIAGCGRNESQIADMSREFPAPHFFQTCDVSLESDVAASGQQFSNNSARRISC
jgi:NAD(P)-dependent dehydrogenase (short-subunit alcohol dehydrogenase family)